MLNSITNASPGARMINTKIGEQKDKDGKVSPVVRLVHFAPGETKDVEVLNMDDAVFRGMVDAGDLIVGDAGTTPPTPAEKAEREAADVAAKIAAADQAGYDRGYAKAQAEATEAAEAAKTKK